jgi:two-component system LytT family sensor kinase
MLHYKHLSPVLFLLACLPCCAQESTPGEVASVVFADRGLLDARHETDNRAIHQTVSGFVTLTPGAVGTPTVEYRGYYPQDSARRINKIYLQRAVARQVYLKVGQQYCIEATTPAGEIIQQFIIERVKRSPHIMLGHAVQNKLEGKQIPYSVDSTIRFVLPPDDAIQVLAEKTSEFEDSKIEFTLVNLDTKRIEYHEADFDLATLTFKPGMEYQLRFNYIIQPESPVVYYIKVKPRWYQMTVTYVIGTVLLAGGIFWGVTGGLKRKIRISQKKQRKLEEAAIRLQSMLNPHFTFNAMSSIQGLINTGRIEEANHYLQEFSALLRKTLNKNQNVFNSLDQELEMMRIYLRLEALRFNFTWDIQVDEGLDTTVIDIPTLILQPLVENSIKHNMSRLGNQGQLQIRCQHGPEAGSLLISIKDNGTWQEKSTGYGLSLTEERIQAINRLKQGQSIALTLNKKPGTQAMLTFYRWLNI